MGKRIRSTAASAAAEHWAKRPKPGTSETPMEISDDLEIDQAEEAYKPLAPPIMETEKSEITVTTLEKKHHEKTARKVNAEPEHNTATATANPVVSIDSDSSSSSPELKGTLAVTYGRDILQAKTPTSRIGGKGSKSVKGQFSSPVRLLANHSHKLSGSTEEVNTDCVEMDDLIGADDLSLTFQFNFSVEVDFFLKYLSSNVARNNRPVTFITGSPLLHSASDKNLERFTLYEVVADISNRYGSHHTKMMINFFTDHSCEVVVMTCNLTQLDFAGLTQMCWRSGRVLHGKTSSVLGNRFQQDLTRYLKRYKKPALTNLAKSLDEYDWLSVDIELIASTPGYYDLSEMTDDSEIYGYGKLFQVLRRNDLLLDNSDEENHQKNYNVLAQVSSMAYPFALQGSDTASVFTHLLCPLIFGKSSFELIEPGERPCLAHQSCHSYTPRIVFPAVSDITKSTFGFVTAAAIHFRYTGQGPVRSQHSQNIKPYLCRWMSSENVTGREKVTPHVKIYACDNGDDWKSFRWVMVGSHNLSKQAWGGQKSQKFLHSDPSRYELSSYELSVFLPLREGSRLRPVYSRDTLEVCDDIPVRFPFHLPPKRYSPSDRAWSNHITLDSKITDSLGNSFAS